MTITPGAFAYNDVHFEKSACNNYQITGSMDVDGDMHFNSSATCGPTLNGGGGLLVEGDLHLDSGFLDGSGNFTIEMDRTTGGTSNVVGGNANVRLPNFEIDIVGTLDLSGRDIFIEQDFTYTNSTTTN